MLGQPTDDDPPGRSGKREAAAIRTGIEASPKLGLSANFASAIGGVCLGNRNQGDLCWFEDPCTCLNSLFGQDLAQLTFQTGSGGQPAATHG